VLERFEGLLLSGSSRVVSVQVRQHEHILGKFLFLYESNICHPGVLPKGTLGPTHALVGSDLVLQSKKILEH
jgi:hypothetical protein